MKSKVVSSTHIYNSHESWGGDGHFIPKKIFVVVFLQVFQSAKRHLKDVLKMSYEDTQDISARCLLDA